jgi:hypothetical protein
MLKPKDITEEINGARYFTVNNFAYATKRSPQNVRSLISYGNRIRRLKTIRLAGKPLIPYSELLEFPFTVAGRHSTEVYHYTEDGEIVSA